MSEKEVKEVKEFTVKRSSWLRGDARNSCLRNNEGKMCCLGFLGQACGYKDDEFVAQVVSI